ncbi:MAG TPA: TPM domain-containing protein [Gemmatimonadaceae bacterium]|nr:TPM domain-containing protein [Gemmatimonadaceae bacterium]
MSQRGLSIRAGNFHGHPGVCSIMKTMCVLALLIPAALGAQADTTKLRWVPDPRTANGSWVSDPARHLDAASRAVIDSTIAALERETSAEIAVVVIDSLDGLEPADAALLLHRRWGVGKRERDNGIVLLWSPALRKVYVAVGYGLEGVIPDARAGRIQDQAILPHFRAGDFNRGMVDGVAALAAAAREETYSGLARATAGSRREPSRGAVASVIATAIAIFAFLIWLSTGRYPRRCPRGHGFMRRLSEQADNAHLDAPSVLEEKLGSMDYDVWTCARCDATTVVPHRKLFSSFAECPECKRRTLKSTSRQLVAPTYSSTGTKQVSESCKHCSHARQYTETIPKLVRSSSGSGSPGGFSGGGGGGSSFGGGSSGGGGAGRSY